jgi:CHASE2 domain-containing sensor protein/tRNA A-37 threonylcarbamoyl transferase component Bud32
MWRHAPGRRALGLLAAALLAATAGLAAHSNGALNWLERGSVDARFSLRGPQRAPAEVAVVGIDDNSLGDLPRYPFSRRLHARVMENLHAAGARLIVYDISFDRPSTQTDDQALFIAAERVAPVVFATSLISPSGATQVLGGNPNLAHIGDRAAAADLTPDGDGVLRHLLDQTNHLPTIAAAVAWQLDGKPPDWQHLRAGWIDFPGPPGTVQKLSFVKVLENHFDPASVRGKVVVVGATASPLQDLHSTAAGGPMPGPEVQADAISTVLRGFPLRSPSNAVTVLLIVLLALLAPIAGVRLDTLGILFTGIGLLCLWSVVSQLAFDSGVVLDYANPLVSLLLGTAGTLMITLQADRRERTRLRKLFAANATAVVEQVLHGDGHGPLEPTAIIAGYKIEEVVGRGGMAVVYRATQLALDRTVAIKLITPERSRDAVFRARFRSESRIAASIEHPNVIPVYEAGEDDGLLFIAMRLVDGIDLSQLLRHQGSLEPTRAIRLIEQLAGALDAAHARGLVHRDVKPANVLVTFGEPEHAYLTDFGIAKHMGASEGVTRADQWIGTLDYLAPEQIQGKVVDGGADIYALAGVLHHCLTGQTPFPRDNEPAKLWALINAPPPAPSRLRASLPEAIDEVIARGMAKDPALRFASATELAQACARVFGLARVAGRAMTSPPSTEESPAAALESAPTVPSE